MVEERLRNQSLQGKGCKKFVVLRCIEVVFPGIDIILELVAIDSGKGDARQNLAFCVT